MKTFLLNNLEGPEGFPIEWDPTAHETPESAARALYAALRDLSASMDQDPDLEVLLREPDGKGQRAYQVLWESGPYYWSVGVFAAGEWGFCETDYGFDLIFNDER